MPCLAWFVLSLTSLPPAGDPLPPTPRPTHDVGEVLGRKSSSKDEGFLCTAVANDVGDRCRCTGPWGEGDDARPPFIAIVCGDVIEGLEETAPVQGGPEDSVEYGCGFLEGWVVFLRTPPRMEQHSF